MNVSVPAPRREGRGAPTPWTMTPRMAERRGRMRAAGAEILARSGVEGLALIDAARAADIPASAGSHGYRRKGELVFDILHAFVDALHEYVGAAADAAADDPAERRLAAAVGALLDGLHDHRAAHAAARAAFDTLPDPERAALRYSIRTLLHRIAEPLDALLPGLAARPDLRAPLVQGIVAMACHAPVWMKPDGALDRPGYARLILLATVEGGRAMLAEAGSAPGQQDSAQRVGRRRPARRHQRDG